MTTPPFKFFVAIGDSFIDIECVLDFGALRREKVLLQHFLLASPTMSNDQEVRTDSGTKAKMIEYVLRPVTS